VREVSIPAVGFAMTEGVLVRWLKQPGERVEAGDAVVEIETDKALTDLEAPAAGTLGRHRFDSGAAVPVGVALTVILLEGESEDEPVSTAAAVPAAPPAAPTDRTTADLQPRPAVDVDGDGPRHRLSPRERAAAARQVDQPAPNARRAAPDDGLVPIDLGGISTEDAIAWLRQMLVIREFETRCDPLALAGKIMGGVHSSLGQEAVAVGTASALRAGDHSAGTHRSHHHAIAMGIPPSALMAELFGRTTGSNGGRGGSMHVADLTRGFIGGNGIVGAGVGLALGAALSFKVRESGQVAVGFVGDGGANTGRTWESVNLATVWRLPLVVICENNLYAVETATAKVTASDSIAARAAGFGIRAEAIDGQDIAAVHRAVSAALERGRAGEGPTFIEARTYRYEGHSTGQNITYRTTDEVSEWRDHRDPIARLRTALTDGGSLDDRGFDDLVAHARSTIDESVAFAEASPWPEPAAALRGVTTMGESVRRLA
jgi:TPP-dependent pyruvate/acetoin dehydrogenase alpha subunit